MTKRLTILALLPALLAAPALCPIGGAQPAAEAPVRIHIGGAITHRQVWGRRAGEFSSPTYRVHARVGQHLRLRVQALGTPGLTKPLVWVTAPSGWQKTWKSASFDARVSRTGDYIIKIGFDSEVDDRGVGPFLLKVWLRDKRR